jgi:hypothetical protein
MDILKIAAGKIPPPIIKTILDEKLIDKAVNIQAFNTPMEYLFDVYEEFIDAGGEHDDWTCFKCREHILQEFRKLKPHLIEINANQANLQNS